MGRQALGQFLKMQGDGDVGETIEMPDEKKLRRLAEQHKRTWSSLTYEEGDVYVDAETEVFTWMAGEVDSRRREDQPMVCVMDGLRQMGTKSGLPTKQQEKLDRICNYLDGNRHRMRYDEYLEAGYPIASGVIEGACRHLVKDRMERSGMRWSIDGAQAMLDLRSISINGQWPAFCTHRIQAETQRLHPKRQLLKHLTFQLAL